MHAKSTSWKSKLRGYADDSVLHTVSTNGGVCCTKCVEWGFVLRYVRMAGDLLGLCVGTGVVVEGMSRGA